MTTMPTKPKTITHDDAVLLDRLPIGKWFCAGALSIHASKLSRLVRLGLLVRRYSPYGLKYSHKWEYMREA